MHKNRIINVIVVLLLLVTGCSEQSQPKSFNLGVLMYGDSRQVLVDGFIDGLNEFGYIRDKNTHYTILNANNDRNKLVELVNQLDTLSLDLIVSAGGLETDVLQNKLSTQSAQHEVAPVVVLYINSIIERGTVKQRDQAGWKVTGVDNLNAEISAKRLALLTELLPDAERVLILYYPDIAPSRIGYERALEAAPSLGVEIVARPVNSIAGIKRAMQNLRYGEVDAMLTVTTAPIDNSLAQIILPRTNELSIPVFTHSQKLASLGAIASYGAKFHDLGKQASRLANKVLQGANMASMPFETPQNFVYTLNQKVFNQLGGALTPESNMQIEEYLN